MSAVYDTASVRRVRSILEAAGLGGRFRVLDATARRAEDAAMALGVSVCAIVKTLIFEVCADGGRVAVAVLLSGDRHCDIEAIPQILGISGAVHRPDAERVKALTGYSIGGVSPLGLGGAVSVLIDGGLGRSSELWAAGGHPHCVFGVGFDELCRLTGGRVSDALGVMG